jgi:subtilisin family serine protease
MQPPARPHRSARPRRWRVSPTLARDDVWAGDQPIVAGVDDARAVLIELNLSADAEPRRVLDRFVAAYRTHLPGAPDPERLSTRYARAVLTRDQLRRLDPDGMPADDPLPRLVSRIWPDYMVTAHLDRSAATVKADAATRTYAAAGAGVVWAVLDSGICQQHPHFGGGTLTDDAVMPLHRDFTYLVRGEPEPAAFEPKDALVDPAGHGTHVAAIIAGTAPAGQLHIACQDWVPRDGGDLARWTTRTLEQGRLLSGLAPQARLVSLRVLADDETTCTGAVIKALDYLREINGNGTNPRIHGVNLSLGVAYNTQEYATGQSPLCRELDLLVGTGVVAVVSAGNDGAATDPFSGGDPHGSLSTIADPGNAEKAITVGSTHRDSPHTYGVSFFSSKGPTLDGRRKPDLVAPGERITSAAVGRFRAQSADLAGLTDADACYIEESGTSQAAPHVSGAVAALLSARPELKGRPDRVKKYLCDNATPLGRHEFFEGAGLLDLMRVFSNV